MRADFLISETKQRIFQHYANRLRGSIVFAHDRDLFEVPHIDVEDIVDTERKIFGEVAKKFAGNGGSFENIVAPDRWRQLASLYCRLIELSGTCSQYVRETLDIEAIQALVAELPGMRTGEAPPREHTE